MQGVPGEGLHAAGHGVLKLSQGAGVLICSDDTIATGQQEIAETFHASPADAQEKPATGCGRGCAGTMCETGNHCAIRGRWVEVCAGSVAGPCDAVTVHRGKLPGRSGKGGMRGLGMWQSGDWECGKAAHEERFFERRGYREHEGLRRNTENSGVLGEEGKNGGKSILRVFVGFGYREAKPGRRQMVSRF